MANFTSTGADTYPAGHVIQIVGTNGYANQSFDADHDVIIEIGISGVLASSKCAIFISATVNINHNSGEGFEGNIYRKATTMGAAGTEVSGATKINSTAGSGNDDAAIFTYFERGSDAFNMYAQASFYCLDESPPTGTMYYAMSGSGYATQSPSIAHDGNKTIIVMEYTA